MIRITSKALFTFLLLNLISGMALSAQMIADRIDTLMTGVVMVIPVDKQDSGYKPFGQSGSGTLVDIKNKLILTNFHVIYLEDKGIPAKYSAIGITREIDAVPSLDYVAELVQYSESLDIAVLKIVEKTKGKLSDLEGVYSFEWGSSDRWKSVENVRALDTIYALGYPGSGGATITVTRGQVSGFAATDSELAYRRQFIKSDVPLSAGNSGGTTLDSEGRFIGIPTMINLEGHAVLGYIRSSDLATPLVEAAQKGKPLLAQTDLVVVGRLFDARSKKPIENGLIFFLKPGVSIRSFLSNQDKSLVAAFAQSTSSGAFPINGLKANSVYSVLALHQDYGIRGAENSWDTALAGNGSLDIPMIKH